MDNVSLAISAPFLGVDHDRCYRASLPSFRFQTEPVRFQIGIESNMSTSEWCRYSIGIRTLSSVARSARLRNRPLHQHSDGCPQAPPATIDPKVGERRVRQPMLTPSMELICSLAKMNPEITSLITTKTSSLILIYGKREPVEWLGHGFPPISILLQQINETKINER